MNLVSKDVELRPYRDEDREPLIAILGDAKVMELALVERAMGRQEAEQFIDENFSPGPSPKLGTLCLKSTGEVIGFAGYLPCRYLGEDDIEFGFVVAKAHQHNGYATQIGREQIIYALTALAASRIFALCNPENKASRHVLEVKLQMTSMPQIDVPGRGLRKVYVATRETLDLWK